MRIGRQYHIVGNEILPEKVMVARQPFDPNKPIKTKGIGVIYQSSKNTSLSDIGTIFRT
jgi:hypothetical protein